MSEALFENREYQAWLKEVKDRYARSQVKAAVRVNSAMLEFYWLLGAEIADKQKKESWGSGVIDQLSRDLKAEFSSAQGFSTTNLRYMKQFFLFYCDFATKLVADFDPAHFRHQLGGESSTSVPVPPEAISTMSSEMPALLGAIPWRHHVEIMQRVASVEEAIFYLEKTVKYGWSRQDLIDFLKKDICQSQGKAVTNFTNALPDPQSNLASETLKDPYNFDFIALAKGYKERELEDALAENITQVLLELGQGFAYVGRQIRMKVGETEVFADLLFYHLSLRCYVVVELKATAFKADFIGQLGLYVSAVNHLMRIEADNPTIGLLICKTKDNVVAEWALESSIQPIGISAFELTELMPKEFESKLPSIEEIEASLKDER
ncbi:MAG: PDDEXK nuclease domain-containing protein [Coriobacteriia bacterium]|nr:PDDEXK nuclease domain-containing protein [Coriobacteriia bacterium]MCL2537616.1 PDDEXK nuclease domain-containing protein [Coriobacteriia bacterium]